MDKIDNMFEQLDKTKVKLPSSIRDNIHQGIRHIREQKKKTSIWLSIQKLSFRYALASVILIVIGLVYLYSIKIPITVINKKGHITIADAKKEWQKWEGRKIKSGCSLKTGHDSEILIQFGKHLTIELKDENYFKIKKIKKFFTYEEYEIYIKKGNQTYTITKNRPDIQVITDHLKLRHIGTIFNVTVDEEGTHTKVLKGKIAVKRNTANLKNRIKSKYKNDSNQEKLESILNTELVVSKGESVFISKQENRTINNYAYQIMNENKTIDKNLLCKIEKNFTIAPQKENITTDWEYNVNNLIWATPLLYKGHLYVGTENGQIISISEQGKLNWKIKTDSNFLNKGLIYKNRFYIVDSNGILFAINIHNSKVIWKKQVGETMYSSPIIQSKKLFIATATGKILALHPDTGKILWQKKLANGIFCNPVITKEKIYIGTQNGTIYCINHINSSIQWTLQTETRFAVSSPIIHKSTLFIGNNKGLLYAININNGKVLWEKNLKSKIYANPVVKDRNLYIATFNGMMYSINLNGKIKWKLNLKENIESTLGIIDKKIIIPTKQGNIYIIDKNNGTIIKILKLKNEIVSTPVINNHFIFISTLKGNIYKCTIN